MFVDPNNKRIECHFVCFLYHLLGNLFSLYFTKRKKKWPETNWKPKKNWFFFTESLKSIGLNHFFQSYLTTETLLL